jgi:hypothetical protein
MEMSLETALMLVWKLADSIAATKEEMEAANLVHKFMTDVVMQNRMWIRRPW